MNNMTYIVPIIQVRNLVLFQTLLVTHFRITFSIFIVTSINFQLYHHLLDLSGLLNSNLFIVYSMHNKQAIAWQLF